MKKGQLNRNRKTLGIQQSKLKSVNQDDIKILNESNIFADREYTIAECHQVNNKKKRLLGSKSDTNENRNSIKSVSSSLKKTSKFEEKAFTEISQTDIEDLDSIKSQPTNWKHILQNIRLMREKYTAPVDSMGCHKCADNSADEKTQRFQKLMALMLSSQTKDETTYNAMLRLRDKCPTPASVLAMKLTELAELLHPVSFYKNKAKHLQQTAQILIDRYDSDIPNNIKELVNLPGVGPKMAHICMSTAWQQVTGIGVDVHVHRICNRLNWVTKTIKPEQTRVELEQWLPPELWSEVNYLLVGFGQTICTPVKPKCEECLNRDLCPFVKHNPFGKVRKAKVEKMIPNAIADIIDKVQYKKTKITM